MVQTAHLRKSPRQATRTAQAQADIFVGSLQWVHDPSLDLGVLLRNALIRDRHPLINASNFMRPNQGPSYTMSGRVVGFDAQLERLAVEEIEARLNGASHESLLRHVTLQQALSCMATNEHVSKAHHRSPILVLGSPIRQGTLVFGQTIELMASGLNVGVIDITGGVEVAHKRVLMARAT